MMSLEHSQSELHAIARQSDSNPLGMSTPDNGLASSTSLTPAPFGTSAMDERLALAVGRFADASRSGGDGRSFADRHRSQPPHRLPRRDRDDLITDSGFLPADRLAFASAGIRVTLADEGSKEIRAGPGDRSKSTRKKA